LQSGDFTESQFEKAFIGFAVADRAKFKGIRGRDSQWFGSDLKGADFSGADLRLANFQFADLTGANFRNAKLNGAFLVGSILTGADFTGAELEDTDFTAASIDARQLSKEQLKGVCRTRLKIDGAKSEYFYVRLKSFIKSTRFASGLAFRDEYLQAHLDLPQDHPGLPVCRHRTEIPTHRLPIAFVVEPQELRNSLDMSIAGEILDSGGRRRLFSDRARRHMERIRSHILQARFLSILPVERMSLADLRASSGRLDISAFDSTGAELILPLLKIRDLPGRRGQQNLVKLGTQIAASEAERWKNLQERLRTRQEFEQRHRSERRHAAMPISWDAALSRGKEAKGAFIEALMTTRVPLGSLLPDESCVSESNLFCHIEFFVFDPEKSAGRAPEIVALAGADRLSQLLDGMLAVLPKTLPFEVRAEIKTIEPQRRTLVPKYGSEVLEPRSTMRIGVADVKVYSMGSFSGFLRSSTRARRRALPARISARLQSGDEGIRNLASTIARFDGWKCYEHLGLNRALAWDRIIIPERALESALLTHRKSSGELSATLDLTDIRIVADSVMGATYRGQDCLLVGSIRSMAVGDRDGNRLFEIDPASLAIAK
jgi:hypothetical protein